MNEVTDPAILTQLNAGSLKPVTDPAVLSQLNGAAQQQPATIMQKLQASVPGRMVMGALDPVVGGLQSIAHLAKAIPGAQQDDTLQILDNSAAKREKTYQDSRSATGSTGLDLARLAGNAVSPVNYLAPEASGAAKLGTLGRIGVSALNGGVVGAMQPVTDKSASFASQKAKQTAFGAAAGAALPAAGAALKATGGTLLPAVLGDLSTGAGGASVKNAFAAGKAGGSASQAFTDSMRGNTPWDSVVSDAKAALANMRAQRGAEYRSGMADVSKDKSILNFDSIDAATGKTGSIKNFKGQDLDPKTADVRGEITAAIDKWKQLDPADYHTPEGFDALKQQIGSIKDNLPAYTPQRAVADNAYNAIRKSIADQAPAYDKVMQKYTQASESIDQIQRELSLKPKANPATALRKLQSVMRDNVNTNWGDRAKKADTLAANGAADLLPKLAGQAMSSIAPRGLARVSDVVAAGLGGYTNPFTLAALPLMSPRVVGEFAHGAGVASRHIGDAALAAKTLTAPGASAAMLRLSPILSHAIQDAARRPGLFGSGPAAALLANPAVNRAN